MHVKFILFLLIILFIMFSKPYSPKPVLEEEDIQSRLYTSSFCRHQVATGPASQNRIHFELLANFQQKAHDETQRIHSSKQA